MSVRGAKSEDLFFLIPAAFILFSALSVTAWDFIVLQGVRYTFSPVSVVGLLCFMIGLAIRLVAWRTLRQSYSWTLEIREGHRLVTHGIYRYVRHPIYLGSMMGAVAPPVFVSSVYGFLVMLALIPLILYRIGVEERMLIEGFRDEYVEYMEKTRRLIPYIY